MRKIRGPKAQALLLSLGLALSCVTGCGNDDRHEGGDAGTAAPVGLAQLEGDGLKPIPAGGATTGSQVVFEAYVPGNPQEAVALQVEVRSGDEPFQGLPNAVGPFVPGGTLASAPKDVAGAATHTSYRWQARTVDSTGRVSDWVEFAPVVVRGITLAFVHTHNLQELQEGCAATASARTPGRPLTRWLAALSIVLTVVFVMRRRKPLLG